MEGQNKKKLRIFLTTVPQPQENQENSSGPTDPGLHEGSSSAAPPSPLSPSPSLLLPPPPSPPPLPLPLAAAPFPFGCVSIMGYRCKMEDCVAVAPRFFRDYDFYAVYDGHGGIHVAELCRDRIHVVLAHEMEVETGRIPVDGNGGEVVMWKRAMATTFARVDGEVAAGAAGPMVGLVGTTAVVAAAGANWIVVGNCGDSRAVLSRGGVAVALSYDHKPDRPDETARVQAAGGQVFEWNGFRVYGVLATSRAFGDLYLKPYVIVDPETTVIGRTDRVVRQCLNGTASMRIPRVMGSRSPDEAAAVLAKLALARGSSDNISIVVVDLRSLSGTKA